MKPAHDALSRELVESSRNAEWKHTGFVAELFEGRVAIGALFPFPGQDEEDRQAGDAFLNELDRFLAGNLDADEIDRRGEIPASVMKGLAALGAFGMKIPREYGGLGLSDANYGRAIACVARYCASTAATLSAHQSIGVPEPLRLFGSEEQKRKFLPRIARGAVSAFALTEPEVGSDPARIEATAEPVENGAAYRLNGEKLWCTNGVIAEVLVVMARMKDSGSDGRPRISAFIVEKGMPGFEVADRCRFMGLNGIQNAHLRFTNVRVPRENLIWEEGKGLHLALATLDAGRLSLPWAMIGASDRALEIALDWSERRVQWGAPIARHEAIAAKLARMRVSLAAMRAVTETVTGWLDRRALDVRVESAIAKVFCSERAWRIADDLLQIRGGRGYERADSLAARGEAPIGVERIFRDARINLIVEGTSEILRLYIAREALDAHLRRAGAIFDRKLPWPHRAAALLKAGAFYLRWYPALWFPRERFGLSRARGPVPPVVNYVSREARRLARTAFHLMLRHGPALERRQLQLGRLVDIALRLFGMMAITSRAEGRGEEEGRIAALFCSASRFEIDTLFRQIRQNPDRFMQEVARGSAPRAAAEAASRRAA